jgi:hypothetical protein
MNSTVRLVAPSYRGTGEVLKLGWSEFRLQPGARVHRTAGRNLAWVLEADQSVHLFAPGGEITPVPIHVAEIVRRTLFGP